MITAFDRGRAGDDLGAPLGLSKTNRLVTGFTLNEPALTLEIAAYYNKLAVGNELSLRGRLIHVEPDDGFEDEFTFPDTPLDRERWRLEPQCVTYFRASADVGADDGAEPCPGAPMIPAGDYLLELYAVGGDPNLPYYAFQDDGREREVLIPGAPCPPYPRVRVTDVSRTRVLDLGGLSVQRVVTGPALSFQFRLSGQLIDGLDRTPFEHGSEAGLEFDWTFHYREPPVSRSSKGANHILETVPDFGCFDVEVTVTDKTCGLSKKRLFPVRLLPDRVSCAVNSGGLAFLYPKPEPSSIVATVGLRPAPGAPRAGIGVFRSRRPFEARLLVVPCCGPNPFVCPAPDLRTVEFRLATPSLGSTSPSSYAEVYRDIAVENLCLNQGSGPIWVHVKIDDLGAIPSIPARPDLNRARVRAGESPAEVYLQGRRTGGAWVNIGNPMSLYNRPQVLESSYWEGFYVAADQSYHYVTRAARSSVAPIEGLAPSRPVPLPLEGLLDLEIPSFSNQVGAGMVSAFTNVSGRFVPEKAVGSLAGQLLGNALSSAPLEAAAREVVEGIGRVKKLEWCKRLRLLDSHFGQTLFESILYTGTIGPVPVTVWASIQLALNVTMTAQTNIEVTPFALLEGEPAVKNDLVFESSFDLRIPCEIRADVLFGIASIAARLIPEATASFWGHVGTRDLETEIGHRFRVTLALFFELKACLLFACFGSGRVPLVRPTDLVNTRDNDAFSIATCSETVDGLGGELGEAFRDPRGAGGQANNDVAIYQTTSAPVTVTSPDGTTTIESWIDPDGTAEVFVNGDPTGLPGGDAFVGAFVDPSAAFLSNGQALVAWSRSYEEEAGLDRDPETLAEQNLVLAQSEIVVSRVVVRGARWETLPAFRISDPPAEVPDLADRRADGRSALAANPARGEALVAWVRYETPEFFLEEPGETTTIYVPGTVDGAFGLEERNPVTVRPQLEATAIYARRLAAGGPVGPRQKISPPGINIEPSVAVSPSGAEAYCVWVHDPVHRDLVTSNRGRLLLYSVYSFATGEWTAPAPVLADADAFPGLLEPAIALRGDGRGLLAFTALEEGRPERDAGLAVGSRYVYASRLEGGVFGDPVRIHGKCQRRVYGHWVRIPIPQIQARPALIPGFDAVIRYPEYVLTWQGSDALGAENSRGVVQAAAIGVGEAQFTPAMTLSTDDSIRSNVAATIHGGALRTISLNGGSSRLPVAGRGGGGGVPVGYETLESALDPDLAITSCVLSDQFPSPGAVVTAAVTIENLGLAGPPETTAGECIVGLRAVFVHPDGSEEIHDTAELPVLGPGGRTTLELMLEQPHDPVLLRVELHPNPIDLDPTNDGAQCYFGSPEPADFACEVVAALAVDADEGGPSSRVARVLLSWTPRAAYDEVLLYRDGQLFAALPGACTRFVDETVEPGRHVYEVRSRIGVSRSCRVPLECDVSLPEETFRRGDVNGSGEVDISDPIVLLRFLFVETAALGCPDAGDADDSGELDLADPLMLLDFLFLAGAALPAPGPLACGADPSGDDLGSCEAPCAP